MVQNKLKVIASFCCTPALAAMFVGPSAAQQQSVSDAGQLEEIVVTAEKRDSTVQATPVSITAISAADIQERGATDLSTLLASVPGVSIRTSGPGLTEFEMRGVASTGGNSPTVGFYYDDTPLTAPADTNEGKVVISPALYDLNRVEVLRGPQGTLYGSGSMGGTIKLVPNAPNTEAFDASAELVAGGTDGGGFNHAENAMVNLPFGAGIAAVRIVGSYEDDSGWIDRIVAAPGTFPINNGSVRGNVLAAPISDDFRDVNDIERTTVRVSVLVKPVDGLTITPSFFYQKLTSGGLPYIDSDPGTNAHYQPFDVPESVEDEFKLGSLKAQYQTDLFAIDTSASYWTKHEPVVQDASESWQTGVGLTTFDPAAGGLGAANAIEDNYSHQTTGELRVSSVGDSSLKWLIGYLLRGLRVHLERLLPGPGRCVRFDQSLHLRQPDQDPAAIRLRRSHL